jgi:hypothetical protein
MNKNSKYNNPIGMQNLEGLIGLETDSSLKMAKPTGFILKPTVLGKKPTGFILKPTVPGKKPTGFILKPTVPGKKPIGFGFKPIGFWKSSFNSSENSNIYNSITI